MLDLGGVGVPRLTGQGTASLMGSGSIASIARSSSTSSIGSGSRPFGSSTITASHVGAAAPLLLGAASTSANFTTFSFGGSSGSRGGGSTSGHTSFWDWYASEPPKARYEWGYPCTQQKLPLMASPTQKFLSGHGSLPNPYPYGCGSGQMDFSGLAQGSDFNGKYEYLWMPDKSVNCMHVPAPLPHEQRPGMFSRARLRLASILGFDESAKNQADEDNFAWVGKWAQPSDSEPFPKMKISRGGTGNDILWKDPPPGWQRLLNMGPLKALRNFKNTLKARAGNLADAAGLTWLREQVGGKDWRPTANKYHAAYQCESDEKCAYFIYDDKNRRAQFCRGNQLWLEGYNNLFPVYGFQRSRTLKGMLIGVKPSWLQKAIPLEPGDKLLVNTKAVCPARDGRYLSTEPMWQYLSRKYTERRSKDDILRPTHWWYDLVGPRTFHRSPDAIQGELCAGEPTLVPQTGAFAVLPKKVIGAVEVA